MKASTISEFIKFTDQQIGVQFKNNVCPPDFDFKTTTFDSQLMVENCRAIVFLNSKHERPVPYDEFIKNLEAYNNH
jgi:hypothetical protein